MKKKGLVAMGLAGVLTVGMCMPVLAAEGTPNTISQTSATNGTPNTATADTTVEITEPITYTVSIPAAFKVDGSTKKVTATLSASGVNLEPGKVVKISANKDIALVNENDSTKNTKWNMILKDQNNEDFTGAEIGNETVDFSQELSLVDGTNSGGRVAGVYKGVVTFSIGYDDSASLGN